MAHNDVINDDVTYLTLDDVFDDNETSSDDEVVRPDWNIVSNFLDHSTQYRSSTSLVSDTRLHLTFTWQKFYSFCFSFDLISSRDNSNLFIVEFERSIFLSWCLWIEFVELEHVTVQYLVGECVDCTDVDIRHWLKICDQQEKLVSAQLVFSSKEL